MIIDNYKNYKACILFDSTENYRLQSAYEKNLIIKMVLVSDFFWCTFSPTVA